MKNTMTPNLRFPEFREAEAWIPERLGDLIDIKGRIGYRGYTVNDIVKEGEGAVALSPSNISDNGGLSFENSTYISWFKYEESPEIMLEDGFTILVKTGSSFGKSALVKNLPLKATINPQLVVFKPLRINSEFLFLLVSNSTIQKQIQQTVVGGAIPTLSQDSISKFDVLVPTPPEQQKIAATLTTLDNLITAQNQQLAALQAHKKGLMQQLFPAEGERAPRVRFGEFEGEWEEKTLGEISDIKRGAASQHLNYVEKDFPNAIRLLRINDFLKNDAVYVKDTPDMKRFRVRTNDILIAGTGATAGITFIIESNFNDLAYSYNAPRIRVKNANCHFIFHYLNADSIILQQKKLFVGNAQPFLDTKAIGNFNLFIPSPKEQQKIADTLSSLDALITAQTKKTEALQAHKKGLMQQLFPNPNEE